MFSGRFNTLLLILKQCVVFYQRWSTENNTLYPDWLKMAQNTLKRAIKRTFPWKLQLYWFEVILGTSTKVFREVWFTVWRVPPDFETVCCFLSTLKQRKQHFVVRFGPKWAQNTLKRAIKRIFPWKLPLYWFGVVLGTSQNVFGKI